jgi:hypothetical protein
LPIQPIQPIQLIQRDPRADKILAPIAFAFERALLLN